MDVEVSDANPDESTKIEVESDTEGDTSGSDDPVFIKVSGANFLILYFH